MSKLLPSVSIIVPTLNEVDNVVPLISRIDAALNGKAMYEVIFIDDHSTDKTLEAIVSFAEADANPLRQIVAHSKNGMQGKAFSLIEGFESARMDLICIIDADLQYPPEAIQEMLEVIDEGFDVVVANREASDESFIRRFLSRIGRIVYGKLLYSLDCDVQSGLKLFRKTILDHIVLNTTPWTFDISFLVQARDSGYRIGTVPIPFAERHSGTSKVNVLKVGLEIVTQALRFKLGIQNVGIQGKASSKLDTDSEELIAAQAVGD